MLLALSCPEIEVIGISCVAGNADVDTVLASTLKVLDAVGAPSDLPVARGCALPLVEPLHPCPEIHGKDSLGDLTNPALPKSDRRPHKKHAVDLLIETLQRCEEPVTLIALAPLTNVAMAIRMAPEVMTEKITRIVWMGGSAVAGGNASPWAEANAFYDPEAAHIVLTSGVDILMYTWDVYLKVEITREDLIRAGLVTPEFQGRAQDNFVHSSSDSGARTLGGRLLCRDMDHFDMQSAQIGDAGAVAVVVLPFAARSQPLHVAMELK